MKTPLRVRCIRRAAQDRHGRRCLQRHRDLDPPRPRHMSHYRISGLKLLFWPSSSMFLRSYMIASWSECTCFSFVYCKWVEN
ncbi:hypothetical protein HN51_035561 [Arachis hypogaea]